MTQSTSNQLDQDQLTLTQKNRRRRKQVPYIGGVAFTLAIAIIGYLLAQLPGLRHIGPMACAIMVAIVYRQAAGYPEVLRPGIEFSSKKLLRYAIVLYGLKLNIAVILNQGLPLLARGAITIILAIGLILAIAKLIKADMSLSMLLGVGTGVCGASAIAAVSPIMKSRDEDTAISVGIIALMGTVFAITYTILRTVLPLSPTEYGIWSGISLHEIAHVALAAGPAGPDSLAIALLAKLGRVFLLVPLSFVLILWMKMKTANKQNNETKTHVPFPWFLVGFIIMSIVGSYLIGPVINISEATMNHVDQFSSFILVMAMTGLGLNVNLQTLRTKALKPLIAMTVTSIIISCFTYLTVAL